VPRTRKNVRGSDRIWAAFGRHFREPGRFWRLFKIATSEPPRVRAMLGAIGQQLGQPEARLSVLRKSLNPLSRFEFGSLAALERARQWQAKEREIGETI
jgi:hypothetical protein